MFSEMCLPASRKRFNGLKVRRELLGPIVDRNAPLTEFPEKIGLGQLSAVGQKGPGRVDMAEAFQDEGRDLQ